ncbi:hypothetical protein UPYG_G00190760 [Umbra pygmaea]|uniref:Peptidase S1 domain-containing protein n=1 Tax=Umbra pygmaea TaxID=75934 RepID=A0ABD0WTE9_UMBPY
MTEVNGKPAKLQCAHMTRQLQASCGLTTQYKFCAQSPGVHECCGDSGGGLEYNDGKLYGVLSSGELIVFSGPAFFMELCYQEHRDWIHNLTSL